MTIEKVQGIRRIEIVLPQGTELYNAFSIMYYETLEDGERIGYKEMTTNLGTSADEGFRADLDVLLGEALTAATLENEQLKTQIAELQRQVESA
jgi:hypothetical protein